MPARRSRSGCVTCACAGSTSTPVPPTPISANAHRVRCGSAGHWPATPGHSNRHGTCACHPDTGNSALPMSVRREVDHAEHAPVAGTGGAVGGHSRSGPAAAGLRSLHRALVAQPRAAGRGPAGAGPRAGALGRHP
ncbi:hypothetical protein G6F61_014240 [Rhizopus arrhizus]|nr:hypothetical protein G6F61_014240 [Rhizopus arrhizus]